MRLLCLLPLALFSICLASPLIPCYRECESRLSSDEDEFFSCNETCKIEKCQEGCDLWTNAIHSSCHEVCEEDEKIFKSKWGLYCVRGCNIAINAYMKIIEDQLGTPAQPYLVADTRTNTSIMIRWQSSTYENMSYLVQLRQDASTDYEYYQPFNLLKQNYVNIEGLHPYTKYRFRVAFILLENYPPLFSEESIVISTLPYGAPSTAPIITCLTAVSCSQISLSFDPPPYANGPILSYVLYIYEFPFGNTMIKDISDTSDGLHYMINGLRENTTYKISLSTRNNMGEGPTDERNITTLRKRETSSIHHPPAFLVFATERSVLKQGLRILDETQVLYKVLNTSVITGLALDIEENIFFVSDSEGNVHIVDLEGETANRVKKIINSNSSFPTKLSVDWLNNKLYLAERNQISRCDMQGTNCELVLSNMKSKAKDLHVDPFNGYLYFSVTAETDPTFNGGLYRIDLIEFYSGCVDFGKAQLIVNDNYLNAFAVDYKNFRLLLPSTANNTVVSVALDGNDVVDIRENSQTPQYTNVKSIAFHQELLYWTTGNDLFGEEYHRMEDRYYQNVYFVGNGPFSSLNIYHPDNQPYPVPLNPVETLEGLFGSKEAKIRWSNPRLLGGQGKGSWQKWSYEISLKNLFNNSTIGAHVNRTVFYIDNLKPNTTYSVSVRAYSVGGQGPWSSEFTGSTLKYENEKSDFPYILFGAREGLLRSNFVGENSKLIVPKINLNNAYITDICWYDELLFINSNTSFVYIYNTYAQPSLTRLKNITLATSIAIDWFAPKLYWASPTQQMIFRSNIDGSLPEPLPILTIAKEIAIDSLNAYLYWATSHSVERSHLNGMDHFVYMKNALFSGKHVMGLTLDIDKKSIYWMIRSYEGSILYYSCLAEIDNHQCNPEKPDILGSLSEDGLHGPVWYFSNRLFWLHETQKAFVSDIYGNYFAKMEGLGLEALTSMEIVDKSLHQYPEGLTKTSIKVIPFSVDEDEIQIYGTHDKFNITWAPDDIVNYGDVFYDIRVDDGDEVYSLITNKTLFIYPPMKRLPPYTLITVAIQAFTYWASSKQTIVEMHSPMSVPSPPVHPRVFITHKSSPLHVDQEIVADFRWSLPEQRNGIITSYHIMCWLIVNNTKVVVCDSIVDGKTMQYQVHSLLPNTLYYFQVTATTDAGAGLPSDITEALTSIERPIPKLLLAKTDSVKVADIDFNEEKLLYGKATHPAAIAYLAEEKRVFWMESGALMVSSIDGENASLIKHLSSEGTCLTVDWIGRQLYWAEVDKKEKSRLFSVDLSYDSYPKQILNSSSIISNLEVEPFSASLIYTLASGNNCSLMISDLNGYNIRPFFSHNFEYEMTQNRFKVKRTTPSHMPCNCNPAISVGEAITIDSTNTSQPRLLFTDGMHGHIWSSDIQGCYCHIVLNATENENSGLPPTSITVDSSNIYWSNKNMGKIYSISKSVLHKLPISEFSTFYDYDQKIVSEEIRGVRSIRAIGHHLQPYPDPSCLVSRSYQENVTLLSHTSHSLTVFLPKVHRPKGCYRISSPSDLYTIFYGPTNDPSTRTCFLTRNKNCNTLSSYNNTVTIYGLSPYTNYTVSVAVKNYYSLRMSDLSTSVVFQTKEGAPSPPVNVTAKAVTPFMIYISWGPPMYPNGYEVSYGIQLRVLNSSKNSLSSIQPICGAMSSTTLSTMVETTEAGKEHYVSVRAYSSDCQKYNDSDEIFVTTFLLPNNFTFVNVTSTSLTVLWLSPVDDSISSHKLEYTQEINGDWNDHSNFTSTLPNEINLFIVENLEPKTKYIFRLILLYNEGEEFIWPQNFVSEFSTLGDIPGLPGIPQVKQISREVYQVSWGEAYNYGYLDIVYELEIRSDEELDNWKHLSNSSSNQWILNNFSGNAYYEFRVRALNEFGSSNYSYSKKLFFLPETGALIEPADDSIGIIIASSISIVIFLSIFLVTVFIIHLKREKCKKILTEVTPSNQITDLELATLEDLPLHANFIHQTNALYNLMDLPSDEEFLSLPQIKRDQIIATRFLGSGAFGEVYEGEVYGLGGIPSLKIAIKTLKKGATHHEKEEFLKEAKLMSNFKHEHILQLLAVCFDNHPNFIILELMGGGDLLSFLRSSRPTIIQNSTLTMDDLLKISVDVAKGCKYLEDQHFVHRDLAARNCLVSSYDRDQRIVKIGDFGLARDIYKSDYYRKEGEGLLPVRWMAPESLVYGIFTSQSDVWAFGVLLWEVMTLGQQPYPALSNMEVFYHVRQGNHLDKPKNCPDGMLQIMEKCWSFNADDRPTFCYCLHTLQEIRNRLLSSPNALTAVYNYNYFNDENIGFDNLGYCGSVVNTSIASSKTEICNSATPGTYVGRYIVVEDDTEYKNLGQNVDSRSTQSYPAALPEHEANNVSLRRSLSWTHATPDLEGRRVSTAIKTKNHRKPMTNKYIELLGDNEDADGYQLPLSFHRESINNPLTSCIREPDPTNIVQPMEENSSEHQQNAIAMAQATSCSESNICQSSEDLSSQDPNELVKKYPSFVRELNRMLHSDVLDRSIGSSSADSENSWLEDCDSWSLSTASTATCPLESSLGGHDSSTLPHATGVVIDIPDSSYC